MKKFSSFILLLFYSLALFPSAAQQVVKNDYSLRKLKQAALDIIRSSPTCALITLDKDSHPIARTMDPFLPDSNFVVLLGTNPKSRKVMEIIKDSSVCLYYGNASGAGYVVIQGIAHLVNDANEKNKRWKEG